MLKAPFYELERQIAIDLPDARAVFTTTSWGDVRERESEIARRLGVAIARPTQVHGATVIQAEEVWLSDRPQDADGIATASHGIAPTVICADCVPVVIAGAGAVAAVHAGWKGLCEGVIEGGVAAVRRMSAAGSELPLAVATNAGVSSAQPPLAAAIGPCAGACCYEVSDQLHETFARRGQDFRNGQNLDLNAIARCQLADAGVETVYDVGLCTICSDPELLFSHRRDHGETGRQGALIWLT